MNQPYTREALERMDIDDLDRMAFGVAQGDTVTVLPHHLRILYPSDLANPQARFDAEGMAWVRQVSLDEPVEVSVDDEGHFCLEDGHHRRFAAQALGLSLKARVTAIKGRPIERLLQQQALKHPDLKRQP